MMILGVKMVICHGQAATVGIRDNTVRARPIGVM